MQDDSIPWLRRHRARLRLGVRIVVASLLAYILCPLLGLTQTYPAVLTAVIVMQASVGASLKAMLDRFLGSLVGAVWGVAVLLMLQHFNGLTMGLTLVFALVPLAFLAAFRPAYRAAPTTAVILLLTASGVAGPLAPAIHRMLGIGLGSVVALMVSLVVLPERAYGTFAESAGQAVVKMSQLATILMKGLDSPSDPDAIHRLHDEIRKALAQSEAVADEATRERVSFLAAGIDPQPLCRTLRRLRNDLIMIGRTTKEPLPETLRSGMAARTAQASTAIAAFLRAGGEAIARQEPAPPFEPCRQALAGFASKVAELRKAGLMRGLPDDEVGRAYGLVFGLEQLSQDLEDLVDHINELAQHRV